MKTIAIVHHNTPELTDALISSVRKVGCDWQILILDNSDERPYKRRRKGVVTINNRGGRLLDLDAELSQFHDKCEELAYNKQFVSARHMLSVQYLWNLLPDGFILMDSDILLTKPFEYLWDETYAAAGHVEWNGRRGGIDRLKPFLCYINVPLLNKYGVKYYDPTRCWGLCPGGLGNRHNLYDTGASLLEDIRKNKPMLRCRNYQNLEDGYLHFGAGSYRRNNLDEHKAWLEAHADAWK